MHGLYDLFPFHLFPKSFIVNWDIVWGVTGMGLGCSIPELASDLLVNHPDRDG